MFVEFIRFSPLGESDAVLSTIARHTGHRR